MENNFDWTVLIPAGIALVTVIVGSIVQFFIAKKHITASLISANRQVRIDCLRNEISEYIPLCLRLGVLYQELENKGKGQGKQIIDNIDFYRMEELRMKIILRLDSDDEDQQNLKERLNKTNEPWESILIILNERKPIMKLYEKIFDKERKKIKAVK